MLSVAAARMADSPDFGAESSFPERHLEDDKAASSGIGPVGFQSAGPRRQTFEPSPAPLSPQQGWPYNHGHVGATVKRLLISWQLTQVKIHAHGPPVENSVLSALFPQPGLSLQPEWAVFRKQASEALLWQAADSEMIVEDDSDLMQSPNGSPSNASRTPPTLPANTQRPRRRSTRGVTKPTRTPALPSTQHPVTRTSRPYIPDFDYNTDWLDPSDPMATTFLDFFPEQPTYGDHPPNINGTETTPTTATGAMTVDTTTTHYFLDTIISTSPPSKPNSNSHSKRIAHKLSEKTRRNRLTIAIREIQKLLPSEDDDEEQTEVLSQGKSQKESRERSHKESLKDSQSHNEAVEYVALRPGVPSSKLDVAEMAVGFIRELKARNVALARRVRELEEERARCDCGRGGEGGAKGSPGVVGDSETRPG